jgi:hypothetical protein
MSAASIQWPLFGTRDQHEQESQVSPGDADERHACPVCGAMIEARNIGGKKGWACLAGGYAHYYQAQYGHLEHWFTSGEGNMREPLIKAMNCTG